MDDLFVIHNLFTFSTERFRREDPQLKKLKTFPCKYTSPLIKKIAHQPPGIYTLAGGRQVGKSTLIKQIILTLMQKLHISQHNIFYLTGEVIANHSVLLKHF